MGSQRKIAFRISRRKITIEKDLKNQRLGNNLCAILLSLFNDLKEILITHTSNLKCTVNIHHINTVMRLIYMIQDGKY